MPSNVKSLSPNIKKALHEGVVIPAHPLALNSERKLDRRRQYALTRYYIAAGAGGIAVGVHNTQLAIREKGMYEDVLRISIEAIKDAKPQRPMVKVAGVLLSSPEKAVKEAEIAANLGYDLAMVMPIGTKYGENELLNMIKAVSEIIPVFGFYPQVAIGGKVFSFKFWRELVEIPNLYAIKIAPFNRYYTIEVVRAVAASSRRDDIALYTGNDDNIIIDLITPFKVKVYGKKFIKWIVGGLLGQWSVWTKFAVNLLNRIKKLRKKIEKGEVKSIPLNLLKLHVEYTDANAAIFDVKNNFRGLYAGINEILRRQGLLEGRWTLDPKADLSPGQLEEIERVLREYPHLHEEDDKFIKEHISGWLP